jgi:hypothetical protein
MSNSNSSSILLIVLVAFISFFLLSPSYFFWELIFFDEYPEFIRYKLWPSGLNIFDIFLIFSALFYAVTRVRVQVKAITGYSAVVFISTFSIFMLALNSYDVFIFHDGMVFVLRCLLYIWFLTFFLKKYDPNVLLKILVFCCVALSVVSAIALTLGYESNTPGRMNYMGMGTNGTADFAIISIGLLLYMKHKGNINSSYFYLALLIILLFLPFAGSRRSIVYVVLLFSVYWTVKGRFLYYSTISLFTLSCVSLVLYYEYPHLLEDVSLAVRVLETIDSINAGSLNDGRDEMYISALQVLSDYPLGIGLSDWAIQNEMGKIHVGSHMHNLFLQTYAKFGVFTVVLLYFLLHMLIKKNDPILKITYIIILISMLSGYGYWNQKTLFIHMAFLVILYKASYENFIPSSGLPFKNRRRPYCQ